MKAKDWIIKRGIKPDKAFGKEVLPASSAYDLMDLFAEEKTNELFKMVLRLKEICEGEVEEFNIPELNDLIDKQQKK
jgi:hypothetical protein